jgi:low temperature requirement protein LtrA
MSQSRSSAFSRGNLPIIMGLALVAVGIEHTIDKASHHVLSFGARWALCGGVALYLLSISVIWVTACRRNLSWLMVASVAIALTLAIFGGLLPPLVLQGLLLAMLVGKLSIEILKTKPTATSEDEIIKIETRD